MAVPSNSIVTVNVTNTTPTMVRVPVAKRGTLSRVVVHETTTVGGDFAVDIYSREITPAAAAGVRAPYRVASRQVSNEDSDFGSIEAVGVFDWDTPYATEDGGLYFVITPSGAGARTFSIAVTTTDPILA